MWAQRQGGPWPSRREKPWRIRRRTRKYSLGFLGAMLAMFCLYYELQGGSVGFPRYDELARGSSARRLEDPKDIFTMEQRRQGAVILHAIGLLYTFAGIAITCDEFFVPALEVITEVLDLSPDVAGATFMAAGGSAPEFFTSLIGAMVVESDIGTGTIIGSAVFNVLFVIGACALVAPEPLKLTWFPLARDSSFYVLDLIVVSVTFLDEQVKLFEAIILFILYLCYASFMVFSSRVEAWVNNSPSEVVPTQPDDTTGCEEEQKKCWATPTSVEVTPHNPTSACYGGSQSSRVTDGQSLDGSQATSGYGRHGERTSSKDAKRMSGERLQAPERKHFRHKSLREHNNLIVVNHLKEKDGCGNGRTARSKSWCEADSAQSQQSCRTPKSADSQPTGTNGHGTSAPEGEQESSTVIAQNLPAAWTEVVPATAQNDAASSSKPKTPDSKTVPEEKANGEGEAQAPAEEEEENEPLSLLPPGSDASIKDWFLYLATLPICLMLIITVPDVRREGWRHFFVVSFVCSICWIAGFTWAMVWFATVIAETCGLEEHIMGLTVLAAGTSVPDLLTSVIVARQGHGDMAISSSIGSNIFDVTVGLPIPWIIYTLARGKDVSIKNEALEISVLLLLAMLGFTICTIMCHRWVMTTWMGGSMIFLYLVFLVISILLTTAPKGSLKLIHV